MFFEDHATIYRWISICDKIVWIDAAYYHYIQRGDSICHTINPINVIIISWLNIQDWSLQRSGGCLKVEIGLMPSM